MSTSQKPKPRIKFLVGANIGNDRFEEGDTAPYDAMSAATRSAWVEQGLIELVEQKAKG